MVRATQLEGHDAPRMSPRGKFRQTRRSGSVAGRTGRNTNMHRIAALMPGSMASAEAALAALSRLQQHHFLSERAAGTTTDEPPPFSRVQGPICHVRPLRRCCSLEALQPPLERCARAGIMSWEELFPSCERTVLIPCACCVMRVSSTPASLRPVGWMDEKKRRRARNGQVR